MKYCWYLFLFLLPVSLSSQNREELLLEISAQADDTVKVHLYESLYHVYRDFDQNKAMQSLRQMEELSRKLQFEWGIETAMLHKATEFYFMHQSDSSLYYFRKYLNLPQVRNASKKKAKGLTSMGSAFQQKQQYDSALVCFDQAALLIRESNHPELLCALHNNMGMTVFSMGNAQKSLEYFELAYACILNADDQKHLPEVINNLASLYAYTGKENPDKLFLDLINNKNNQLNDNIKGSVFLNLGSFYYASSNFTEAEKYFLKADSTFASSAIPSNPEILHSLGSIYRQKNQPQKALGYLLKVQKNYPKYNQRYLLFSDIARTYQTLNKPDSSQHYYEAIIFQKDSMAQLAIDSILTKARQNLDFAEQVSKINELKLEKELLQAEKTRIRMLTFSIIAFLVLAVILAFVYFKKERQRRKFNEFMVAQKNRKLADFSEKITQRNKLLAEVESKFEAFKDAQNLKESLKADIIENMDLQGDGEIFTHYFEDQHKGFYEALKKIAPDLTNNDLRLCTLTKLRMSLKETAGVLNLSVDAVKSGRYRIRKKLNLDADANLSDYLNEF